MAEKTRRWGQILAALGVMSSLFFVGYEIRQNTRVARASAATPQSWWGSEGVRGKHRELRNKAPAVHLQRTEDSVCDLLRS